MKAKRGTRRPKRKPATLVRLGVAEHNVRQLFHHYAELKNRMEAAISQSDDELPSAYRHLLEQHADLFPRIINRIAAVEVMVARLQSKRGLR